MLRSSIRRCLPSRSLLCSYRRRSTSLWMVQLANRRRRRISWLLAMGCESLSNVSNSCLTSYDLCLQVAIILLFSELGYGFTLVTSTEASQSMGHTSFSNSSHTKRCMTMTTRISSGQRNTRRRRRRMRHRTVTGLLHRITVAPFPWSTGSVVFIPPRQLDRPRARTRLTLRQTTRSRRRKKRRLLR